MPYIVEQLEKLQVNQPIDYRDFGGLINRIENAAYVRGMLRAAIGGICGDLPDDVSICILGSATRGDFDAVNSDIDMWFLNCEREHRNTLLHDLVAGNQGLIWDVSLDEIDAAIGGNEKFMGMLDRRYPTISMDEFENDRVRRVQLLLEVEPLVNPKKFDEACRYVVETLYGLTPTPKIRRRTQKFTVEVQEFFNDIQTKAVSTEKYTSLDYAKFYVTREINEALTKLNLVQTVFSKRTQIESPNPSIATASSLRQPRLFSFLFWASAEFLNGRMMRRLGKDGISGFHVVLRSDMKDLLAKYGDQDNLEGLIWTMVQRIARTYSDALNLLHTEAVRNYLIEARVNTLSWDKDTNLQMLKQQSALAGAHVANLGRVLESLFVYAGQHGGFNRPYIGSGLEAAVKFLNSKG